MAIKSIYVLAMVMLLGLILPSNGQGLLVEAPQQFTADNVYPYIDRQLKAEWWQYLRGANLLYRGVVDQGDKFLFLSIYRNIVGTFLSITEWTNGQSRARVATLVRLGNGYEEGSEALYGPVVADPVSLNFKLGDGEFFVDTNEQGELQVNGKTVGEETTGTTITKQPDADAKSKLAAKCVYLDSWVRQNNWQYLRNAQNIYRSGRITNQRFYCAYNYVNLVGTFFVLASTDVETGEDYTVDTFVRLGDGFEKESEAKYNQVSFEPVILQFDLLRD